MITAAENTLHGSLLADAEVKNITQDIDILYKTIKLSHSFLLKISKLPSILFFPIQLSLKNR